MLKLKVLRGAEKKVYTLHEGTNTVGRSDTCDVAIASDGVSKKHAQILVKDDICSVTDLKSSNGTFVNGVKVQDRILKSGDRIAFHDVILELKSDSLPVVTNHGQMSQITFNNGNYNGVNVFANGNNALASDPHMNMQQSPNNSVMTKPKNINELATYYFENIVMPGVYKINENYHTKHILAAMILIFAFVVTFLSTVPMSGMMKDSIQKEAQRRALTIARQLADAAERALSQSADSSIRTDFAENEDGVQEAMVVAKEDGHIIAPLSKAQSYSGEQFVAQARKHEEAFVLQTSSTTIGASVPVRIFSNETGQQLVVADAIVLYKMTTLDWSATVGLFARVLMISLLVGFFIFVFIYKIVTEPIRDASIQLDRALRGEISTIETKYIFQTFSHFVNNVNSALARMGNPADTQQPIFDRPLEGANLTRIITDPAICIDTSGRILSVNSKFEELTSQRLLTLQEQNLSVINDQPLQLNLEDLLQKSCANPQQVSSSQLEISGILYELDAQAVTDGKVVNYVIVTVKKGAEA